MLKRLTIVGVPDVGMPKRLTIIAVPDVGMLKWLTIVGVPDVGMLKRLTIVGVPDVGMPKRLTIIAVPDVGLHKRLTIGAVREDVLHKWVFKTLVFLLALLLLLVRSIFNKKKTKLIINKITILKLGILNLVAKENHIILKILFHKAINNLISFIFKLKHILL